MKLGIISDTHNFFDPQIPALFKGVDHILHGGDIGLPNILSRLEQIAPVTAVLGNTDDAAFGYRLTEILELAGRKFLVHHIVNPHSPDETLKARLEREQPDVVIFGHTHKPFSETIRRTLYFNPGYAGRSRFGMPRSVAILDCTSKGIRHEYFPLSGG
jgi:putative phosphoesterase